MAYWSARVIVLLLASPLLVAAATGLPCRLQRRRPQRSTGSPRARGRRAIHCPFCRRIGGAPARGFDSLGSPIFSSTPQPARDCACRLGNVGGPAGDPPRASRASSSCAGSSSISTRRSCWTRAAKPARSGASASRRPPAAPRSAISQAGGRVIAPAPGGAPAGGGARALRLVADGRRGGVRRRGRRALRAAGDRGRAPGLPLVGLGGGRFQKAFGGQPDGQRGPLLRGRGRPQRPVAARAGARRSGRRRRGVGARGPGPRGGRAPAHGALARSAPSRSTRARGPGFGRLPGIPKARFFAALGVAADRRLRRRPLPLPPRPSPTRPPGRRALAARRGPRLRPRRLRRGLGPRRRRTPAPGVIGEARPPAAAAGA